MINTLRKKSSNVPAAATGLALGTACLGAALNSFSPLCGNILVSIAAFILILFFSKVIFSFDSFKNDLKHPVFCSILPTSTMALMIVSSFLAKVNYDAGKVLWFTAIALHVVLMISFLFITFKQFNFMNVVPSYFIPPVGIVVACVSGQKFDAPLLCQIIFYFGCASCALFSALIFARLKKAPLPDPKKATFAILAAPTSLCVAGYLSLPESPSVWFMYILAPLSLFLTVMVYYKLFRLLRTPFNPGFSAFTFPLVISAVAMFKLSAYLGKNEISWSGYVHQLALIELCIASAVVLYALTGYLRMYLAPLAQIFLKSSETCLADITD